MHDFFLYNEENERAQTTNEEMSFLQNQMETNTT